MERGQEWKCIFSSMFVYALLPSGCIPVKSRVGSNRSSSVFGLLAILGSDLEDGPKVSLVWWEGKWFHTGWVMQDHRQFWRNKIHPFLPVLVAAGYPDGYCAQPVCLFLLYYFKQRRKEQIINNGEKYGEKNRKEDEHTFRTGWDGRFWWTAGGREERHEREEREREEHCSWNRPSMHVMQGEQEVVEG